MALYQSDSSDNDLFLTQNTFKSFDSENTSDDALDVKQISESILGKFIYQPIVSDISDDELLQASLAFEEQVAQNDRFDTPKGDEEMARMSTRRLAESTIKKVKWAVGLFRQWQSQRNERAINNPSLNISPINVRLEDMTKDELNYSIARFLCEVKKANGDKFPGDTLHELVICLQLHFDTLNQTYKFLQASDFVQIRNTLDGLMKDCASEGLGIKRRQAEVITLDEEEQMWTSGVLGSDSPTQLLNTLVYLLGLNFALRGGQEHRNLRYSNSQLSVHTDKDGGKFLRYTEDVSKANQGGLKHRKIKPKVVDAYENTENPSRCIVRLYEKYIGHCPTQRATDAFYLRPLARPNGNVWYTAQQLGRHKLSTVVSDLCKAAGIPGNRTNHSLRASAATRMYDNEVDEQLICKVTGHRSNAVRGYKRTSDALKKRVNSVVQGTFASVDAEKRKSAPSTSTASTSEVDDRKKNITLTLNFNI